VSTYTGFTKFQKTVVFIGSPCRVFSGRKLCFEDAGIPTPERPHINTRRAADLLAVT